MAQKNYWQKLQDPRWQKLRLKAMEAADFSCEICGDNESTLNVHHKEYFKGHEPWDYHIGQLSVLCEDCHEEQHDNLDLLKIVTSYLPLDGFMNRTECAFLLAGVSGLSYESVITVSCLNEIEYHKKIHTLGLKIRSKFNG
jgi:hypothetical protein